MKNAIEVENWDDLCKHIEKFHNEKNFLDSTIMLCGIVVDSKKNDKIIKMSFGKFSILDETPLRELLFKTIYSQKD